MKNKLMRKIKLFLYGWLICCIAFSQTKLSSEAEVSLLTCAPFDEEVYTVYGHAALRIQDPIQNIDMVFNYGLFSFAKPNFIYRFAKGETDYQLGAINYNNYIIEYQMRGSSVTEQVLNLHQEEIDRLWSALLINFMPENREYRYNFFFDNCATRPAALIEKYVQGKIDYNDPYPTQTFRSLINYCTRNHPWLTFGCDLALGSPTDRMATQHEMMFLPFYLKEAFANASIIDKEGNKRPLIKATEVIESDAPAEDFQTSVLTSPLLVGWLLFACIALLTYANWRKKSDGRFINAVLFFIAGIAGVVLFFISFISEHPCTCPNWNLLWLHPFHLPAAILFCVKKGKIVIDYYHFINFAALSLMILGSYFIPQHINTAFIPLILTLWMRSGYGVYKKIWIIE